MNAVSLLASPFLVLCFSTSMAQTLPLRQAHEDVNQPELRLRPGLQANTNLLFNGWGITPAGHQVPISDLALKLIIAPDKKTLLAVSGGFQNTGLTLLDIAKQEVRQFVPLPEAWNGLALSRDGKNIYVSGGDSGVIHMFSYLRGRATLEQ